MKKLTEDSFIDLFTKQVRFIVGRVKRLTEEQGEETAHDAFMEASKVFELACHAESDLTGSVDINHAFMSTAFACAALLLDLVDGEYEAIDLSEDPLPRHDPPRGKGHRSEGCD